jgi:hypothetical protein
MFVVTTPGRTDTVVIEFPALVGRIPALKDVAKLLRQFFMLVVPEPFQFDYVAANR